MDLVPEKNKYYLKKIKQDLKILLVRMGAAHQKEKAKAKKDFCYGWDSKKLSFFLLWDGYWY